MIYTKHNTYSNGRINSDDDDDHDDDNDDQIRSYWQKKGLVAIVATNVAATWRRCGGNVASLPCRRHVVVTSSSCRRRVISMSSSLRRHALAMSSPCRRHVVVLVWLLCCLQFEGAH